MDTARVIKHTHGFRDPCEDLCPGHGRVASNGDFTVWQNADGTWPSPQLLAEAYAADSTSVGTKIVDNRREVYGAVVPTYIRIAQAWSAILDHEVKAHEVALCMDALKSIRAAQSPDYSDNVDDKDGYMKIFREIIGDDMIEARSVAEYVEKREQRDRAKANAFNKYGDSDDYECICCGSETEGLHAQGCEVLS